MPTHSQLLANIANSLESTGPRTEEGKSRARYNARRHGLTGQFYVMDDDDRQAYLIFETRLFSDLKPVGPCEEQLAVSIAQDHWRMNRAKGIEFNTMGLAHHENSASIGADSAETETAVSHAQAWRSDNKAFANMALYELRLHRIIRQNRQDLNELQARRQAAKAAAREEAELFLANELSKQVVTREENLEVNGFVFSIKTLYREMAYKQTLAEARWYKANNWSRAKQPPFALLTFPKAA